ncbi:MAG: glycine betaine/L-proline ABC transporter ATP-binding protein [Sedimenticola sp.]|jgi:glycine betaine/proline transport system ATP-binding protein|nr:MAG: glycine betaine/L-proline ABC transporter ATP-binding protein [Sedimenticola sp.]
MTDPFIQVKGLYKIFGEDPESALPHIAEGKSKNEILAETGHTIGLKDINLTIEKGKLFVVMGLSGCGKSTLIRHFNRLIDPTKGQIIVDGVDVVQLSQKELESFRCHKISMVFQHFGLMPHRTVLENVAYGLAVQKVNKEIRYEKAHHWLETVGLKGYESLYPSQLSGGQQQRVGLARALCTDADILLMDEAFSALDPLIRSEMQDQLIELQEKLHKTIIFITHDLDEALRLGDRIAILKDGELVQEGAPEDILLNPVNDYVEAFVRDVNRARALTVETVMKPPVWRITANTIAEALSQMRKQPGDYGYYVNDDGYQGVITQEKLEAAAKKNGSGVICEKVIEELSPVSPDSLLESVLPETLDSEYPLPVVDEQGELCGELSRASLAKALVDTGGDESEESTGTRPST